MKQVYDLERYVTDIESLLTTNLNTKITALNTEKADSIVLKGIDSNAYFLQSLNGKQANYNPFILYGVGEITSISQYGSSIQQVILSIIVVVQDMAEDVAIAKRMFRYQRALKEVIEENFQLVKSASKLEVHSLMPVVFTAFDTDAEYRAIGVEVKCLLG